MTLKEIFENPGPWIAGIGATVVVTVLGVYWFWFSVSQDLPLSLTPTDWGAFGDYFGGMTNPFVSLVALFLLFLTYHSQREELRRTTNALDEARQQQQRLADIALKDSEIRARLAAIQAASITFKALQFQDELSKEAEKLIPESTGNSEEKRKTLRALRTDNLDRMRDEMKRIDESNIELERLLARDQ